MLKTIVAIVDDKTNRWEISCKARGIAKEMKGMNTYLRLLIAESLFFPCEELAITLQSSQMTVVGAVKSATVLASYLQGLRSEIKFKKLAKMAIEKGTKLDLKVSQKNRISKPPLRYLTRPIK